MTFLEFLCRVCAGSVHGFVQGLLDCNSLIFQAFKHFVHGVRIHAHMCVYAYAKTVHTLHTFQFFF